MDAKDKVINPHDKFFKEFFSKEAIIIAKEIDEIKGLIKG